MLFLLSGTPHEQIILFKKRTIVVTGRSDADDKNGYRMRWPEALEAVAERSA